MFRKMKAFLVVLLAFMVSSPIISAAYNITAEKIKITSRGVKIPAIVTMPVGTANEKFPVVIIAHGHGGSKEENGGLTTLAESLAIKVIASIRMDFPGCGESTESFTENRISNMMLDIKNSRDYMIKKSNIDADKVGIFGYSTGGRLVMATVNQDSSYKAVTLLAPSADDGQLMINRLVGGEEKAEEMYQTALKNGFIEFTTKYGQKQKLSKGWFEDLKASFPLEHVGNFKGDVLVIYGDKDTSVSPVVALATAGAFVNNAKSVKTHLIKGADHGYGFYNNSQVDMKNDVAITTTEFFEKTLKK